MKVFTSVLAIAMAVASVSAVAIEPMSDLEARCLANGKACKANGSLGNCCSGFCLAQGSKTGKCAKKSFAIAEESIAEEESEPVAQIEARCLANGKACKANGSLGNCCSGFCLAQGSKTGKCAKKSFAVAEESAAEETAAEEESEPVAQIEARCLANGKKCKANGSMGSCCSGFCLAQGNKVGVCKKH
ncbi:Gurmarin-like inhibitors/Antifungal toxin [Akanthomyces lecanii RCEF 1005]|uniref:Gurmarin-like inhibitors/Antifungal toxin n=1 Tax=Akanthomyces lecanii RCEF 1005 TaxID=1081108 RepID=A0A168C5L6_CORDF|nr:Gurmarin-like inhibitors/Antifungal toxin [Akanthomyces lecanii RCEF 1005]